ncbi:MAG: hypothetical protein ACHQX0_08405, partial [Desulfobaccales bacterium]
MPITFRVSTLILGWASLLLPSPAQSTTAAPFPEMHWRNIGPFRGGRTHAATGVADRPHEFYMAQV